MHRHARWAKRSWTQACGSENNRRPRGRKRNRKTSRDRSQSKRSSRATKSPNEMQISVAPWCADWVTYRSCYLLHEINDLECNGSIKPATSTALQLWAANQSWVWSRSWVNKQRWREKERMRDRRRCLAHPLHPCSGQRERSTPGLCRTSHLLHQHAARCFPALLC